MKAFVIKNKEGKYFQWLFNHEPDWEDKLYNGFMHYSKEDAEKSIIQWQLGDCEVVEITITESDLEKEIEHWHNLFKQKEQQFQGVRERYHLLNRLQANYDKKDKLHLSEMQCLELVEKNEKLEQQLAEKNKEIRKQVCNNIREKLGMNQYNTCENTAFCVYYDYIKEILDQIEQAKESKQ